MSNRLTTLLEAMVDSLEDSPISDGDEQCVIVLRSPNGSTRAITHGFGGEDDLSAAVFLLAQASVLMRRSGKRVVISKVAAG